MVYLNIKKHKVSVIINRKQLLALYFQKQRAKYLQFFYCKRSILSKDEIKFLKITNTPDTKMMIVII